MKIGVLEKVLEFGGGQIWVLEKVLEFEGGEIWVLEILETWQKWSGKSDILGGCAQDLPTIFLRLF